MAAILTAEDVVRRIVAECTYVDERGAVGIRLKPAAAIVRQYGEQFRAPRRRQRPRSAKAPALAVMSPAMPQSGGRGIAGERSFYCEVSGSRHAIEPAQFVPVGIAKVSEIQLAGCPLADAGRLLDRGAAIRDPGFVPSGDLFGTAHRETDRAA